ncbi:MAG: hypothetical protein Q9218_008004 [Villophora microphyllina]
MFGADSTQVPFVFSTTTVNVALPDLLINVLKSGLEFGDKEEAGNPSHRTTTTLELPDTTSGDIEPASEVTDSDCGGAE